MSTIAPTDPHDGRPSAPEHAERGAALMAQWAEEDRAAAMRAEVDRLAVILDRGAA